MCKQVVLDRLQRRIDYIVETGRRNERLPEYFSHKKIILQHLQQAVGMVHSDRYGFCIDCPDFIGIERLKAAPGAIRCLECQKAYENREAQRN